VLEDLMEEADPGVAAACRARLEAGAAEGVELRAARLQARPRGFARLLAADLARTWGDRIRANPGEFPRSLREDLERVEAVPAERLEADRADLEEFRRRAAAALAGVEVAAAPTTPEAAPDRERQSTAVSVRFTRLFNALDWPAISLPCGRDGEGRPRALQLAAPPEHLGALCAAARHLGPPGPSGGLGGPETPQPTTRRAGLMADGGEVDVEVE
jgi:Asp-tRNA(Asn)/Glu-tRNA(Gln) amidotransferase A subunit family amidase